MEFVATEVADLVLEPHEERAVAAEDPQGAWTLVMPARVRAAWPSMGEEARRVVVLLAARAGRPVTPEDYPAPAPGHVVA